MRPWVTGGAGPGAAMCMLPLSLPREFLPNLDAGELPFLKRELPEVAPPGPRGRPLPPPAAEVLSPRAGSQFRFGSHLAPPGPRPSAPARPPRCPLPSSPRRREAQPGPQVTCSLSFLKPPPAGATPRLRAGAGAGVTVAQGSRPASPPVEPRLVLPSPPAHLCSSEHRWGHA